MSAARKWKVEFPDESCIRRYGRMIYLQNAAVSFLSSPIVGRREARRKRLNDYPRQRRQLKGEKERERVQLSQKLSKIWLPSFPGDDVRGKERERKKEKEDDEERKKTNEGGGVIWSSHLRKTTGEREGFTQM